MSAPEAKSSPLKSFNTTPLIVILGLAAVFLLLKIFNIGGGDLNTLKTKTIPTAIQKVLGDSSRKFKVNSLKEVSGLYEFELEFTDGNGKFTSYMTKDSKILFTSGIKLDTLNAKGGASSSQAEAKKLTCNDVKKSDKPNLTAFVVSNCPFGLQMQRVFKAALNEAPEMEQSITIRYLGSVDNGKITSMHGDEEAKENLRQICIREEQKEKYWPYVNCYMQAGKTDECLASSGVDQASMESCTTDSNRGLKYAQADFDLANKYQIGASPTMLVNDQQVVSEFDFGGRNPNALKEVLCCASNTKGAVCGKTLASASYATAFSTTDEAAPAAQGSGTGAAGCAPAK